MYRVVRYFIDLKDNNRAYNVGDIYPHSGEVSPDRVAFLMSAKNKLGTPVIEEIAEEKAEEEPKAEPKAAEVSPKVQKSNKKGKRKA